ncbi:MAG: hypothetical protein ACI8TL_000067 [Natronomonas sp.]|jgi:hypothetical protein
MVAYRRNRGMDGPPLKEGAVFGVFSFVAGYGLTLIAVAVGESGDLSDTLLEAAGWIYYNAQFADLTVTADAGEQSRSTSFNYLTDDTLFGSSVETLDLPTVVYHLLPILVLIGSGFALARYVDAREVSDGAVAGGTLALGTILPALVGTVLFSVEEGFLLGSVEVSPALVDGILFVGVFFPVVFGAIGGALSTKL